MKKIVALLLTAVMVLGCMPGLAENTKHERVYVVATADGTIKSITDSVRLENADGLDEIMDQTILTNIQNVGGKETFALDGETLNWKANGKDIAYQGTSDKTPALLPVITLTLDGADVSFADLKDKTGDAVLTISYRQQEKLPILAVTVLPLPEEGITDLKLENAAILSEMGRQALVGWAVPGADEKLNLPASFTASFHADHADLNWMLTFSSADPVDTVCRELNERIDLDIHTEMDEVKLLLKAVQNGEALPETTGKTKDIVPKVNELNDGLAQLNDGAASLADGTSQLSSGASELKDGAATLADGAVTLAAGAANAEAGAATLDEGLAALIANNEALNTGAEALFGQLGSDGFIRCQIAFHVLLHQLLDLRQYIFFDLRFHFVGCHLLLHSCADHGGLFGGYHPGLHGLGILFSRHFLTGCLQHGFQNLLLYRRFHSGAHLVGVCLHLRAHCRFHLSESRFLQGSRVQLIQHAVEHGGIVISGQCGKRDPGGIQPRGSQLLIGGIQHGGKHTLT